MSERFDNAHSESLVHLDEAYWRVREEGFPPPTAGVVETHEDISFHHLIPRLIALSLAADRVLESKEGAKPTRHRFASPWPIECIDEGLQKGWIRAFGSAVTHVRTPMSGRSSDDQMPHNTAKPRYPAYFKPSDKEGSVFKAIAAICYEAAGGRVIAAELAGLPPVDLAQARAFLIWLGKTHTFQTFDDGPQHRPDLTRILHGDLTKNSAALMRLNASGAGIFVMVNRGDGRGRKAGNVQQVRAYFADLDGQPLEPVFAFPLSPHMVVESSPGRWHAYWLVSGVGLEQFKAMQQAIARQFRSDPKVCDLPRVMRVPGFFHNKGEPFLSRIVNQHKAPPYAHEQMAEALGLGQGTSAPAAATTTLSTTILEGQRNDTLFRLARGLVHAGLEPAGVNQRLQRLNAERCTPPLCTSEVDDIAANASAYGSNGFVRLPHALLDSAAWKALPLYSLPIVLGAYRQLNDHNNGKIALPWSDFKGRHGLMRSATFYQYRTHAIDAGVLIQTEAGEITQQGKKPARFAIAPEFLPVPHGSRSAPSANNPERAPKKINSVDDFDDLPLPTPPRSQA
uniref:Primase C-terminal 1 domain-containing protein n=1 Tax=Mycena chlorophos TaxID=658473 RepID=A0ABQ0L308_MYCCL|nr:predicted protein [Mycena chlorophos]